MIRKWTKAIFKGVNYSVDQKKIPVKTYQGSQKAHKYANPVTTSTI